MTTDTYNLRDISPESGIRYIFVSKGAKDIIKIIDYTAVEITSDVIKAEKIYNFGFGDWSFEEQKVVDDIKSQNGDIFKVLYTVLNTIPHFFEKFPNNAIMVTGSDSKEDYHDKCFPQCTKNCREPNGCKNKHQRINVYMSYLNKNLKDLSETYNFFGGNEDIIEPYMPGNEYKTVFVIKKNSI